MSFKMVEPVVVYPEIVSKKALVKLGIESVKTYGNVPESAMIIQPKVTKM